MNPELRLQRDARGNRKNSVESGSAVRSSPTLRQATEMRVSEFEFIDEESERLWKSLHDKKVNIVPHHSNDWNYRAELRRKLETHFKIRGLLAFLYVRLLDNRAVSSIAMTYSWKLAGTVAAVVFAIVSFGALAVSAGSDNDEEGNPLNESRVRQGFNIAPVPLDLHGKNRDLVGYGSYLVNAVGGCNDCHSNPSYAVGGNPFTGQPKQVNAAHYLAGGMTFGPFVSRNLTPENGLPAGHTYQDFVKIMRTGLDLDQAHPQFGPLLQVMPWPTYQSMTDHDLRAIYEYLRSIPSATPGP